MMTIILLMVMITMQLSNFVLTDNIISVTKVKVCGENHTENVDPKIFVFTDCSLIRGIRARLAKQYLALEENAAP